MWCLILIGYVELILSQDIVKDQHERSFYARPSLGKMHIYNRAFFFINSTAVSHANDVSAILSGIPQPQRPYVLSLTCDNGPDFNPESYSVFFQWDVYGKPLTLIS